MPRWLSRRKPGTSPTKPSTRLFFATDVHGSDVCFRKFLNAAEFYGVDHLILGGDMTGKMMVPISRGPSGRYSAAYGEDRFEDLVESEVDELKARIRRFGHYPIVGTPDELAALGDEEERERVFRDVVRSSVADWVQLAEERLRGSGVRCFMAPGNDDFLEIDESLRGSDLVEFAEGRCIALTEQHQMITTGYSNETPWLTERELTEDQLRERIDAMAEDVEDPANLIAVLHAPPYDTEIDRAPKLDAELRVQVEAGAGIAMAPVGSTAVREFIEDAQPLIGLHGHVHEGKGEHRIGRTLCLNPGSAYTEGVLAGAIVELGDQGVRRYQFVAG